MIFHDFFVLYILNLFNIYGNNMTVSTDFKYLLNSLQIKNQGQISKRYGSVTRALNLKFRDLDSKTQYSKQVGSYGRKSGTNGISDLDMLYILPDSEWERFKLQQSYLLQVVRSAIKTVYPNTTIRGDGQVVVVTFKDKVEFEVCPVFRQSDGRYKYPDSNNGGSWRVCNPDAELTEFKSLNEIRHGHLRRLAKMVRAWKNRNNIVMSGFLIDTLCYRFFQKRTDYDLKGFSSYDQLSLDFFSYLENLGDQEFYRSFGSNSKVTVKKPFHKHAKNARIICKSAISATSESANRNEWKKLYGRPFPNNSTDNKASLSSQTGSEQFIDQLYPIELQYDITIECNVKKDIITHKLSNLLGSNFPLEKGYNLNFFIDEHNIPYPFELKWKVKNKGEKAIKLNCLRGDILDDDGSLSRTESTTFEGEHYVECYAIANNRVIARDRISVPVN